MGRNISNSNMNRLIKNIVKEELLKMKPNEWISAYLFKKEFCFDSYKINDAFNYFESIGFFKKNNFKIKFYKYKNNISSKRYIKGE